MNCLNILTKIDHCIIMLSESPYFVFISGVCSILSIVAVGILVKRLSNLLERPIADKEDSKCIAEFVDEIIKNKKADIFPISSDDDIMKANKIISGADVQQSFIMYDYKKGFCLVKQSRNSKIYLYASLDYSKDEYRYITNSKRTPELIAIYNAAYKTVYKSRDLTNKEFIKNLLS